MTQSTTPRAPTPVEAVKQALLDARAYIVSRRPALTLSRETTVQTYLGILAAIDRALTADASEDAPDDLCALLPGTYYMDPPDGGSVTVMEQLRRMADDAAKYRASLQMVPFGYIVRQPDGHETWFKEDPTAFRKNGWPELGVVVHTLFDGVAPATILPPVTLDEAALLAGVQCLCIAADQEWSRQEGKLSEWDKGWLLGQLHAFDLYTPVEKTAIVQAREYIEKLSVAAPACKLCGDRGTYCTGTSGDSSDGNAPLLERCDCDAGQPPQPEADQRTGILSASQRAKLEECMMKIGVSPKVSLRSVVMALSDIIEASDTAALAARPAPVAATPAPDEEAEVDAYLIDRLGKLLAEISIIMKGKEKPLHRHSYHDLPELVKVMALELDMYRTVYGTTFPKDWESSAAAQIGEQMP